MRDRGARARCKGLTPLLEVSAANRATIERAMRSRDSLRRDAMRARGCAAPWPGRGVGARPYRVGGRWHTADVGRSAAGARRRLAARRHFSRPLRRCSIQPRPRHEVVHAADDGHGRAGSVRDRRDRHPDLPQSLGCRGTAFVGAPRPSRPASGRRASSRRPCRAGGCAGLRRGADGEWRFRRHCRCLERLCGGRAAPADVAVFGGTDRQALVRRMAHRRRCRWRARNHPRGPFGSRWRKPRRPDAELQRDGDQDYFQKTIALAAGDVYISPIELKQTRGAPARRVFRPCGSPRR